MTWLPCMFDISHHNTLHGATYDETVPYFQQAKDGGWPFVIHKLSQGISFVDNRAVGRLKAAHQAGLKIGGYHFFDTTGSAEAQVGNFMRVRGAIPHPMTLWLDYEPDPPDRALQAKAAMFEAALYSITGIWPGYYTGRYCIASTRARSSLPWQVWIAAYTGKDLTGPPAMPDAWSTVIPAWWQYSDGVLGPLPQKIPGIGYVDQSAYNGTLDEAHAYWAANETLPSVDG